MEYISIDEKLQIPIILEADVVVVGAGHAGGTASPVADHCKGT